MSASNRAMVLRCVNDGLNKRDTSVLAELYSDCVYHLPLVGELRGEALRQFFASVSAAFPDITRTVEDQFSDDTHVVTRWKATGTHQGRFIGIAPTGKPFTITGVTIDRIGGGRIVEEWEYWDALGLMQQLGVAPPLQKEATAANGELISRHKGHQRYNVRFTLRESDSELTVECEDGSMIPDGEYGLQPEGSNLIHHVQKIGGDWRLFEW